MGKLKADGTPVEDEDLEDIDVPDDDASPAAPKVVDLDEADEEERVAKLDQVEKNRAFAAMRKEAAEAKKERDELKKQVEEYNKRAAHEQARPVAPAPVASGQPREYVGGIAVPQTKAEWDALARQDWQTAVDLKSMIKAREIQQEARASDANARILEDTKQKVLAKHPELADANTEKGRIFMAILDRNPEYIRMPKGPMFAMREMEEEMAAQGYTQEQIFDNKKAVARTEATRVSRGALTGAGRMPEKSGRTVQLSKEDLEFCKDQGIDPKDYARERLQLETNRKGAQL